LPKRRRPTPASGLFAHFVTISLMRFNLLSRRTGSFWSSIRTTTLIRCGRRTSMSVFAPVIFLLVCSSLFAADKVKELQDHFDRDPIAASKIKTLDKLSLAQF